MHEKKIPVIPFLLNKLVFRFLLSCQIGINTKLGRGVVLGYGGLGTVIHDRAIIGDNVNIGTGVTIGGTSNKVGAPVIGDNTILSTGSKVIGPIKVGRNCVVGANCVVISDIPDNSLVVGVPGVIKKCNINISDYN
nr:serine acetyltransferase [Shewanella marisflavi]